MKGQGLKIEFSPDADILSVHLSEKKVDHAEEAGPFIIHLAEDGEPILIEILDASHFLAQSVTQVFESLMKALEQSIGPREFSQVLKTNFLFAYSQFPKILSDLLAELKQTAKPP